MITLDKINHAKDVLTTVARKTDLIYSKDLSDNKEVYLKTENLQVTGSFKLRGAYYKISQLSESEKAKGVIACSAGNHAQGCALASQRNDIRCLICMPDIAPISKVEATKSYGAEVCLVQGTYDDACEKAVELEKKRGMTFIHPFNDPDVIAGQGTIGLEILEQLPEAEAVIVPVGGGGLLSGVACAVKQLKPECKVYGVQAAGAAGMCRSIEAGEMITLDTVDTFADGIAVKTPGDLTFDLISKYVDGMVTVTDDEIAAAILQLMEKQKLVAEGAGAVAVAAVMFDKLKLAGKRVVCVVSGGNIDVNILNRVVAKGLSISGRRASVTLALSDKPGQLKSVAEIISNCGGNVIAVAHDRTDPLMAIQSCYLRVDMETRDAKQINQIVEELEAHGFSLVGDYKG